MLTLAADGVLLLTREEIATCVESLVASARDFALLSNVPLDLTPGLEIALCDAAQRGCAVRIVLGLEQAQCAEPLIRDLDAAGVVVLVSARPLALFAVTEDAAIAAPPAFHDVPRATAAAVLVHRQEAAARWVRIVARAKLARLNSTSAMRPRWHWPFECRRLRDFLFDFG